MNNEAQKSQAVFEQLADLTQTLEKEKVQLTPEVENYVRKHIRAIQDKLHDGQDVYESDLAFIDKVKMWVLMPKEWREKYRNVDEMAKSEEIKNVTMSDAYEANKRHISLKQWLDLLHVAKTKGEKKEWIDETFTFPRGGKIETKKDLDLDDLEKLTRLPENLSVDGYLNLNGCTELTELPKGLSVDRGLNLSVCTGLTELPEGLEVGGSLHLSVCTGLTKLPDGLKIGEGLYLEGCTGLTKLPEGLSVGDNLWLTKNLNEQVKKDAERLKVEGKIVGEIKYTK